MKTILKSSTKLLGPKSSFGVLALAIVIVSTVSSLAEETWHARWHEAALKKMDEAPLLPLPKKSSSQTYRLMISPTWGNRICIRIENNEKGSSMLIKRLSGHAGYGDGPLAEKKELRLTAAEFLAFEEVVRKSGYEDMRTRDKTSGFDGEICSLEISRPQFHDLISSWCPNLDPKERGTEGFVKIFQWAIDKAGITKSITNKGHPIFGR